MHISRFRDAQNAEKCGAEMKRDEKSERLRYELKCSIMKKMKNVVVVYLK